MLNNRLRILMEMKVAQPIEKVFEAVIDPEKMKHYFITSSSGVMEEGKTLTWRWADYNNAEQKVGVEKLLFPTLIVFNWAASGLKTTVTLTFDSLDPSHTLVTVTEDGWERDDRGIQCLAENTKGWCAFLLGLKAFLQYGINLRK